jgi:outer membrane receptor protein involved in Fe transport
VKDPNVISAKTSLSRAALRGGAATFAIALLSVSGAALAQTSQTTTAAAEEINDEGTIVVTGTLINNPNLVASSPIVTRSADVIQLQASNTAESVIRDIPGVVPSIGSQVNNGNGGASFVNLRGIGTNRNLVLLNGARIAPANLAGVVDLNNIPLAMIERVDVSTGAAVTTYGADAISGVVNFVTKRDFTGVDLQLSSGITEVGDGATFRADLTVGGNFADGRGNAVLSLGYQTADPVYQGAREFSAKGISVSSGLSGGGSPTGTPSRVFQSRPLTAGGVPNTLPQYTQTGTTIVNGVETPVLALTPGGAANRSSLSQVSPDGSFIGPFPTTNYFNFNPYNIFQTPFKRFNIFAQANYEISDAVEVYSRGMFSKNNVKTIIAPSGLFGLNVEVPLANPFLNDTIRNQLCAVNIAPVVSGKNAAGGNVAGQIAYVPQYNADQCAIGATGKAALKNSIDEDGNVVQTLTDGPATVNNTVSRRTVEAGPRQSSYTTTMFDYTAGLRGGITDSISWDLSGAYGESENRETATGYIINSRAQEAVLAISPDTCLSGNPACVPLNLFGPSGSISPESAAFVSAPSSTVRSTSLLQVQGLISGDAGFTVPWATEQVAFALGGDYRKWTASVDPDILSEEGQLGGGGGPTPRVNGAYSVQEVFGEVILPVVQDKPFFESLVIEGGLRYSAYSVEAPGNPSYDALTWKVGGNWEIGGGFKIRGNYAVANRAPNIGELFAPISRGLTSLTTDPCAEGAPIGNANLTAVCIAQGATPGNVNTIPQPAAGQANATGGGNPLLTPENATTWTVGAVFQPTFAPGLSLTFDYYNIKVTDAVSNPTPDDAIDACFANLTAASASDPACLIIRRNPAGGSFDGESGGLFLGTSNLGTIFTDGIDITANYSHNLGWANLGVIWNFNWTFSSTFQASPSSIVRECVGYYSVNCASIQPELNSNVRVTLGFDWVDVSVLWRYISANQVEPLILDEVNVFEDFRTIDAYNYIDLTGRFHVVENLDLIFTVNNLFNQQPPIVGADIGSTAYNSGNTYPSTYDPLGRRYTMQVVFKF